MLYNVQLELTTNYKQFNQITLCISIHKNCINNQRSIAYFTINRIFRIVYVCRQLRVRAFSRASDARFSSISACKHYSSDFARFSSISVFLIYICDFPVYRFFCVCWGISVFLIYEDLLHYSKAPLEIFLPIYRFSQNILILQ